MSDRKAKYTDEEWRQLIPVDELGRTVVHDTVLARKLKVSRQTVHAARKRLNIESRRERVRATVGARTTSVTMSLSTKQCEALDKHRAHFNITRSEFVGRILLHPNVWKVASGMDVIIDVKLAPNDADGPHDDVSHILSEASDDGAAT